MGSRGRCVQPRWGAHKPASEEATTVDDNGTMKEGRLTGALALSKCNGLPYCSSGTKKAVYYTKDLFDFVLSFCLLKKASIFCH